MLPGCLQPEERAKPACAVHSPAGTNVECNVGRQNILPLEPSSVLTHGLCAISELYSRYHSTLYCSYSQWPRNRFKVLRYIVALATLTKNATKCTTTPIGAWICLHPEAVRCQRRAPTLTTPLTNPVGRAVSLRVEPTFALIDALCAICEPYCSYRLLHQRLLYVREVLRVLRSVRVGRAAQGAGLR